MSDAPRPSLKLTLGKKKAPETSSQPPAQPPPPSSETPQRKITLKIARKPQPAEEEEKAKKKRPSKKRPAEGLHEPAAVEPSVKPAGPKRLKLNPSKKPGVQSIRIKNKGLVPNRPVGVGYDSEASDTEIDPCIEEQFILRMLPGEDCEYLRQAITERRFDRSEFSFKPLTREGRRAILRVRDKQYAATLVDLPCIIEGMKSWDRRGWYKSADICQMLLVLGPVANDAEAMNYPLPSDVNLLDDKTLQYPHGLTPPLRYVRKRRFRERLRTRTIEQVEKAVEDLIAQDEAALASRYELLDRASLNRAEGLVQSGEYYEDYDEYDDEQDAEGELDEGMEDIAGDHEGLDPLLEDLEAALRGDEAPPAMAPPSDTGLAHLYQAGTPMATKPSTPAADTSGDESESDADEADVPEEELDEEQLEQQRQVQQHREEIAELEALIRAETVKWEKMQNAILKHKLAKRIQDLKRDLSLKKVSVGEGGDADT
ncbi:transcription initiation factor TFIID subunit 7 family protein [Aspergillus clavatus NRRL 1]|uniref:Transcription initiation factor TFIID subunit 7, putative n=1 Tax=Aspergillus clavatus (strain ATCC 1007 / CBS 513.65 / DSM 816 / NCTC 3887 / NRRL 1 / QM 1276 / 107) TaxID=344612 RepID=A1C757_ASPCL|nr:transcription initiation factor TFIID subunit 7, putative [Aspergillus clavatus NRRL 1]EAW14228.1 transcription initiation factor TFIID subunit 7, putative [Aspergillus clavatus NRRL 1]